MAQGLAFTRLVLSYTRFTELGDSEKLSDSPESTQHIPASLPPSQAAMTLTRGQGEDTIGQSWRAQVSQHCVPVAIYLPSSQTCFVLRIPDPCPRWVLPSRVTGGLAGLLRGPSSPGGHTLLWHPLWNFLVCMHGIGVLFAGELPQAPSRPRFR